MSANPVMAERNLPGIGRLAVAGFDVDAHAPVAHRWLSSPHARFWGMTGASAADIADYFEAIAGTNTHEAWIGYHDHTPQFAVEIYAPSADAVGEHYNPAPGDYGMHLLIAPPTRRLSGFTWAVFALVVDTLFARRTVERLVVEPDIGNHGIHTLNRRAGFVYKRRIDMGNKIAWLATCTRADHARAMARLGPRHARAAGRDAPFSFDDRSSCDDPSSDHG